MDNDSIKGWEERLADQVKRHWENYFVRRISLETARVNELLSLAGEYLFVLKASSASATMTVRLNQIRNDPLDLEDGVLVQTIFAQMYLTNAAQPGEWLDVIVGMNFSYEKKESFVSETAQPAVTYTGAAANTNYTPAAQVCNKALIQADLKNAGFVWVNFGAAAVQDAAHVLEAGASITVKIDNLDQINLNFEVAAEQVFITYQV